MAIPKSTIAMAVVACVPFGLAIRATLNGREEMVSRDAAAEALQDYGREQDRIWREEQAREARDEAARETQVTELMTLIGGVAEVGAPLAKLRPDVPMEALPDAWPDKLGELGRGTRSFISIDVASHVEALHIDVGALGDEDARADLCDRFTAALEARWGETDDNVWFVPGGLARAFLTVDHHVCRLTFDRAVPAERWLGTDPQAVVPVWAIGTSMTKLSAWIRSEQEGDDERRDWSSLGRGAGRRSTQLVAHGRGGKVVAITARVVTTRDEVSSLLEVLTERYGEPTGGSTYVFKSKPVIEVTPSEDTLDVVVGKVPE